MNIKKYSKKDFPLLTLFNKTYNPSDLDLMTAIIKSLSRLSDKEQTKILGKMLK